MLTEKKAISALNVVAEMKARAIAVVTKAPYWMFVDDSDWVWVWTDGKEARIYKLYVEGEYDVYRLDAQTQSFPAKLLFMPEDEFKAWKTEQRKAYQRDQRRRCAESAAQHEAQERAALAALKRKYEIES